jgi:hypothetical protein
MKNDNLPPNCPMRKAEYDHYCPSPTTGPSTYEQHGECFKHHDCEKLVKEFKKMDVPKSSSLFK